jgi:hypothetical protein
MRNCIVVVPFGTPFNENTGEPKPHHRKLVENADASAVLMTNKAAAQKPNRIFIVFHQKINKKPPESIRSR